MKTSIPVFAFQAWWHHCCTTEDMALFHAWMIPGNMTQTIGITSRTFSSMEGFWYWTFQSSAGDFLGEIAVCATMRRIENFGNHAKLSDWKAEHRCREVLGIAKGKVVWKGLVVVRSVRVGKNDRGRRIWFGIKKVWRTEKAVVVRFLVEILIDGSSSL